MPVTGGAYRLFRVDDRLLHGQVSLGWGRLLNPSHYLLVDDRLGLDRDAAELYRFAAPERTSVSVLSSAAFLGATVLPDPAESFLIVREIPIAARLLHAGVPGPLNLGGVHLHPGAREVLPYLFLTPDEERCLALLLREGQVVFAQDLPLNPRREAAEWLDPSLLAGTGPA